MQREQVTVRVIAFRRAGTTVTRCAEVGADLQCAIRQRPWIGAARAGGELVAIHGGVIDERTLALQIDEILARSR